MLSSRNSGCKGTKKVPKLEVCQLNDNANYVFLTKMF